ncbi:MAG: hypothetical protein ABFR65_06060 [Pseudomonadota bacterium]
MFWHRASRKRPCGARRMTETAAHLVDQVIPRVPVRQWVLSFPIPLRFLLAAHPHLLSPILQVTHRAISIRVSSRLVIPYGRCLLETLKFFTSTDTGHASWVENT